MARRFPVSPDVAHKIAEAMKRPEHLSSDVSSGRFHIAFYLPALPAGGLERVTLTLCAGLLARGHRIDLVLEWAFGDYLDQIPPGVRTIALRKSRKRRAYGMLLRHWPSEGWRLLRPLLRGEKETVMLRRLPSLVDYFASARPDVVIASAGDIPFLAIWAARIAARPPRIIVAEHNTMSARLASADEATADAAAIARRIDAARRLYPHADGLVAVSNGVACDMARTFGIERKRIVVQYNPVAHESRHPTDPGEYRHRWLADTRLQVVLAAGRLVPAKNFSHLVEAFADIKRQNATTRLIILGDGPLRDELVDEVASLGLTEYVDLPGWQPEITSWARQAQLFVLCSSFEGFGLVLVEAMSAGCPIVSTDCASGPAEILDDGRYGRLVPVGDRQALTKAVLQTLAEQTDREWLRARAAAFGIDAAVDGYEALVQRVTENSLSA